MNLVEFGPQVVQQKKRFLARTGKQLRLRQQQRRGQQKLVVCAMKLAQGAVFAEAREQAAVILVDDLPAELDPGHRARLLDALDALEAQVFVTATETALLEHALGRPGTRAFHVEHGRVTEMV